MRNLLRWLAGCRRGSAMAEFALVAPLLVLILVGIPVLGLVINAKLVVAGAAREAGRAWAITRDDQVARSKAVDALSGGGLKFQTSAGDLFNASQDVSLQRKGDYVHVTVTYRQPLLIPLVAQLIDPASGTSGTIRLQSQAVFRVER